MLLEHLKSLPSVTYVLLSEEQHQDGNKHFHALLQHKKKMHIRNAQYFDLLGHHPNIQATKNIQAWKNYIKKDGDWLEYPTSQSLFDICKDFSIQQWIEYCVKEKIQSWYCTKIWDMCHKPVANTILERPEVFQCDALKQFTYDGWNYRSLVLYGESGCGKTNWAKSHMALPSLFVTHMDVLSTFDPTFHKSIIFDDLSFMHMPRESQIHIVDTYDPRAIHCRYKCAHIPAQIPKVFTANNRIFLDDPAINRRINVQRINGYQI